VLAVTRLVKTLDAALPEYFVAISTTTRTGQALAANASEPTAYFIAARSALGGARVSQRAPARMLVLAETEFWPNLLNGCFRRGIP